MNSNTIDSALVNDFARRSFRDSADHDYIMARLAYRYECDQQFKWSSLQAKEKYLKAILVFNRVSAKKISHKVALAMSKVESINGFDTTIPDDVRKFVQYLEDFAQDRYLSDSTFMAGHELLALDRSVWHIRRYCFYMRTAVVKRGEEIDLFEKNMQKANSEYYIENPHLYKLNQGILEDTIKKNKQACEALVWKNFYYGKRKKKIIKRFSRRTSSVNPTHVMHPEIFSELEKYVDFPHSVRKKYKE